MASQQLLFIGEEQAKLFLLFGQNFEASRCFKSGDLSVRMITASDSTMAMVSCKVGIHQWILAKDSMVMRVAPQTFVFALPGFHYGLALPSACRQHGSKLEGILKRFSSYEDLLTGGESEVEQVGTEAVLWRLAYSRIERIAGPVGNSIDGGVTGINLMIRKHQRAVKTSLLVKLVSRYLLIGVLSPLDHIHLAAAPGGQGPEIQGLYILPSMQAFADLLDVMGTSSSPALPLPEASAAAELLDAMETGSLLTLPLPAAAGPVEQYSHNQYSHWYFNKEGMILLLKGMIALLDVVA